LPEGFWELYDGLRSWCLTTAHHAYRPAPVRTEEILTSVEKAEREAATVCISGLDRINAACGIRFCMDLSATPFYLQGSGYMEGSPFPWLVSDFGLVDAIESGIVKIPRLPVSDTTGRPEPKYFTLWKHINEKLQPGERLPGGRPKPEVVWREAQDALLTLAGQWKERFEYIQAASPGQEKIPPVMIIVCDNTDIAEVFYREISGEETVEVVKNTEDAADEDEGISQRKKPRRRRPMGPERYFRNATRIERLPPNPQDRFQAAGGLRRKTKCHTERSSRIASGDRLHRGTAREAGRTSALRCLCPNADRRMGRQERDPYHGASCLYEPVAL
jgi:hypothetical protein